MKKVLFGFIGLSLILATSCNKANVLDDTQYPEEIRNYVRTHFKGNEIEEVVQEKVGGQRFYNVDLVNDEVNLRFTSSPDIQEIHSSVELPETVIMYSVDKYVNSNYSSNYITNWVQDAKKKTQTVRLNNGVRLEFNSQGDFQSVL